VCVCVWGGGERGGTWLHSVTIKLSSHTQHFINGAQKLHVSPAQDSHIEAKRVRNMERKSHCCSCR
jgi:hypothetical protein